MMSQRKFQQVMFRFVLVVGGLFASALTARAQTPAPSNPTLSDQIARLSIKAAQLLPYLQSEVLSHIQDWVYGIAGAVAVLVLLFSFLRLWRENAGGGNSNLIFFFLRSLFFFGLVGSSVWLIGQMAATGREIAEGNEINGSAGHGLLFEFYKAQRDSFNESYEKFVMGTFTVKVDGRDFTVQPSSDTAGTFLGVLYDSEGTVKDLDKKLNDSSYTLPTLFNLLNASRTILEAGDFWLLGLGAVLVLIFKAAAPLMMAVAIDQKLAHKVTYPFAWGAGVLTLIWPAVSYFTRALAYLFGNMAMALGDSEPLYNWDYAAMYAIKSNFASPVYVVAIATLMMTIAGGCLWISPYLAYRFSMGQVYEGVSAASQFAAMVIGTGVEAYSATAAASINQLAQNTQAQGSYDAQTTEARANRESGMLRNQAAFISGRAQALSSAQSTAGAIMATARAGVSQAYTMFGSRSHGVAGYNEQMAQISTQRSIRDNNTQSARQASETNTDSQVGRKQEWSRGLGNIPLFGGPIDLIREGVSGTVSEASGGKHGAMPLTLHQRGYDAARIEYTSGVNANASQSFSDAQKVERNTGDRIAAISTQQGREAVGAAYAGANTSIAGHQAALEISNQAIQIDFSGRMNSANVLQNAASESAKFQAIATIISRMGSKLAQDIEKGLEMRY
jgi:hypothetical protein